MHTIQLQATVRLALLDLEQVLHISILVILRNLVIVAVQRESRQENSNYSRDHLFVALT